MNIEKAVQMYRDQGRSILTIAKELGHSSSTVSQHLKSAGVEIGAKGRNRMVTDEYVALTLQMRAQNVDWEDIAAKIGFPSRSLQRAVAQHALSASMAREAALQALLDDAAQSLETISTLAGRDDFLEDMYQVRGYAASRAKVARALTERVAA